MRHFITFIGLVSMLSLQSMTAHAQVQDAMTRHYENSKNYTNKTPAGVYNTQTRNVVTFGSFSKRFPQKNTQLAAVSLPKISAGCGGIDIFAGGFSFINGDEIKDLFRNIIQNAKGYAFALAISVFSPLIDNIRSEFQQMLQKINASSINSCEVATSSVNSLVNKVTTGLKVDCQAIATALGASADNSKARDDCVNGPMLGDLFAPGGSLSAMINRTNSSINGSEPNPGQTVRDKALPKNIAWEATRRNSLYGDDVEMREFLMSLTGTQVIRVNPDNTFSYSPFPPIANDDGAIDALMYGGTLNVHECREKTNCLEVISFGKVLTLPQNESFVFRVRATLESIYNKQTGRNPNALTPEEFAFINSTEIPVVRAANIFRQSMPEAAGLDALLNYSDIIAFDLVFSFVRDMITEVSDGASSVTGADADNLERWINQMRDVRDNLAEKQKNLDDRISAVGEFLTVLDTLQSRITANLMTNAAATQSAGQR